MPCNSLLFVPPTFCIAGVSIGRDEQSRVTYGVPAEEEEPKLDFGSAEKNEYVLQNVGTAFRYVDVFDQEYMAMLLAERFPLTARPVVQGEPEQPTERPAVVRRLQRYDYEINRQRWFQ